MAPYAPFARLLKVLRICNATSSHFCCFGNSECEASVNSKLPRRDSATLLLLRKLRLRGFRGFSRGSTRGRPRRRPREIVRPAREGKIPGSPKLFDLYYGRYLKRTLFLHLYGVPLYLDSIWRSLILNSYNPRQFCLQFCREEALRSKSVILSRLEPEKGGHPSNGGSRSGTDTFKQRIGLAEFDVYFLDFIPIPPVHPYRCLLLLGN